MIPILKAFITKKPTSKLNPEDLLVSGIGDMGIGCQIIDKEYRYVYVNKELTEQCKVPEEGLLYKKMWEVFPGIKKTSSYEVVKRVMDSRIPLSIDNEFTTNDGEKGYYEVRIFPVDIGVMIFTLDITERKLRENKLKRDKKDLEEKNQVVENKSDVMQNLLVKLEQTKIRIEREKVQNSAMLNSIGEGVFVVDIDNKFILINKKAEEIFGIKGEDLIGMEKSPKDIHFEHISGGVVPKEERPTYQVLRKGKQIVTDQYVVVRKDGTKLPISLTVTPVRLENKIIGAIEVFRDITEEQRINKSKNEFVYMASHQLRTPLGIIKWYLEILRGENYIKDAPEEIQRYVKEITDSNNRLLDLVRDLLSVARIDSGKIKNSPTETDLQLLISDVAESVENLAMKKLIDIELELQDDVEAINIDATRLKNVLENIVTNAIEYNQKNGKVNIRLRKDLENITIEVEDTGIGIKADDINHLFVKFFRAENAIATNPGGTGLGLYVAKSYIDEWGGKIDIVSAINKGTKFIISLPLKTFINPK